MNFFAKNRNSSDKFGQWRHCSVHCLFSLWTHFCAFFPRNVRHSSTMSASKVFAKIVLINSLGGATIPYAA